MSTDNPYASPSPQEVAHREVPQLEPPQSVSFHLTEEEVLNMLDLVQKGSGTLQQQISRRKHVFLAVAACMAILSGLVVWVDSIWSPFFAIFLVMSVLFCLDAIRLPKRHQKTQQKLAREMLRREEQALLDRKFTSSLLAEGYQSGDQDGHTFRKWKAIPKVERAAGLLLVYLTPLSAHPIPGRAFFDETAFEAYCQLAERLWQQAHTDEASDD